MSALASGGEARAAPGELDPSHPFYRRLYPIARALCRYHRMVLEGSPPPDGPCIYVTLHPAGYLALDVVLAGYLLSWQGFFERGEPRRPLRVVAGRSRIERFLPGLPLAKDLVGIIGMDEEACLAVLSRGEQLLITPGGTREAQPSRDFYRLRWAGRYGFVRLALKTGAPIVPLAVVGGAEAFPGFRLGKLSFWSPLPLPKRLRVALGEPIVVERRPEVARDPTVLKPIQELAWRRTQELYDRLRGGNR
ncbi:MAG TPA: lysophospholipid acyltransferase family protein [Anaeromyxobacter sp.]|nr:lysophospholipid acyltransferase family protein [Anaeromyxobacter sp.]